MIHSNFRNAFLAPWRAKALGFILPVLVMLAIYVALLTSSGSWFEWAALVFSIPFIFMASDAAWDCYQKKPEGSLWKVLQMWLLGFFAIIPPLSWMVIFGVLFEFIGAQKTISVYTPITLMFSFVLISRCLQSMLEEVSRHSDPDSQTAPKLPKSRFMRIICIINAGSDGVIRPLLFCVGASLGLALAGN